MIRAVVFRDGSIPTYPVPSPTPPPPPPLLPPPPLNANGSNGGSNRSAPATSTSDADISTQMSLAEQFKKFYSNSYYASIQAAAAAAAAAASATAPGKEDVSGASSLYAYKDSSLFDDADESGMGGRASEQSRGSPEEDDGDSGGGVGRLRIVEEKRLLAPRPGSSGGASGNSSSSNGGGNSRLDASIFKLRERQHLLNNSGRSSSDLLNPEVILTEVTSPSEETPSASDGNCMNDDIGDERAARSLQLNGLGAGDVTQETTGSAQMDKLIAIGREKNGAENE